MDEEDTPPPAPAYSPRKLAKALSGTLDRSERALAANRFRELLPLAFDHLEWMITATWKNKAGDIVPDNNTRERAMHYIFDRNLGKITENLKLGGIEGAEPIHIDVTDEGSGNNITENVRKLLKDTFGDIKRKTIDAKAETEQEQ